MLYSVKDCVTVCRILKTLVQIFQVLFVIRVKEPFPPPPSIADCYFLFVVVVALFLLFFFFCLNYYFQDSFNFSVILCVAKMS